MTHMLGVPAFKLSDPVTGLILMESRDFAIHRERGLTLMKR